MEDEQFNRLYKHIKRGRIAAVVEFLDQGGNPNFSNPSGWTLLMIAAWKGNSAIVKLLLDRGAALETATTLGDTALVLAACGGYVKCTKLLIECGAETKINPLGYPLAVHMANRGGPYPNILKLLAASGAA